MKKIILILFSLVLYLNAADKKVDMDFFTIEEAIAAFEKQVIKYQNNVYFYYDGDKYHVMYDPEAKLESDYSFLQISNSENFEDVLVEYRKIWNKKDLYIKKFYQLYFLRLTSKDIKYTQEVFLNLQKKFPDIYLSNKPKYDEDEDLDDLSSSKVVFLKDKSAMIKTDPVNEIVVSSKNYDSIPNLKNDYNISINDITRESNLEVLTDLEKSISNFSITRGDILGLKNLGSYDLGTFNNYGILCKTSDSLLYLVSREEIKSIYDFRSKVISTGNVSDIAQVYLSNALKDTGILENIHFKALNITKSMNALEKKNIDLFFLFAPKDYIYKFLKKGFFISSIPTKIRENLNNEQGLNVIKYKIDDRLVFSYQTPKFVVSPLSTLDTNIVKKIEIVANKFGCFQNMIIPKPFYGQVHPEFLKAYEALKAKLAAKNALSKKFDGVKISYVEVKKYKDHKDYIYKISNKTDEAVNIDFEHIKTKYFDSFAIKPHHILKLNSKSDRLTIDPKSEKIISFTYKNPFALRIKDLSVDMVFKDTRFSDRDIVLPLVIGDNK